MACPWRSSWPRRRSRCCPPALLARLGQRVQRVTGGAGDLPARQQTLRATLDWSYQLLTPEAQQLFTWLGVFVGGWTLAAAEVVCQAAGERGSAVIDGLLALINQSLVQQLADENGDPRYRMLETIRAYAVERLAQRGETETLRQQHARYFLAVAETAAPPTPDRTSRGGPQRLEVEQDNLRAALAWAVAAGHAEVAVRLATALAWFWAQLGQRSEGRQWLETALGMEQAVPTAVRARALRELVAVCSPLTELGWAQAPLQESLALWRRLGNQEESAWALFLLGERLRVSDAAQATRLLEESLALFRTQGNERGVASVLNRLGTIAHNDGNQLLAAERFEASLALARELGDQGAMAENLHCLSDTAQVQGDYARALELEQASLALFRELGNRSHVPWVLKNLGNIALQQGDVARARTLFIEVLTVGRELEMDRVLTYGLIGLAGVAAQQQQAVRAARLLGAAEANAAYGETITAPSRGANRLYFAAYTAAARAELDEQAFGVAWAEGRAMTLEQAIAYALEEDPMPAEPARLPSTGGAIDRASRTDVTASAAVRASLTRPGARGAVAGGAGPLQPRDRPGAGDRRGHGQAAPPQPAGQARGRQPHGGGSTRPRARAAVARPAAVHAAPPAPACSIGTVSLGT